MSNTTTKERIVKEIDVTIRYKGKDSVHALYFDDDPTFPLTENEMREYGFCGEVCFEEDDGKETELSLDASNPDYYDGSVIDGLAFNLYPLGYALRVAPVDYAEVVGYDVIYE